MGQDAHRKYKEYRNAQDKLKSYSSNEAHQEVEIKRLQYELQKKKDDEEYERTDKLFDRINGRD